MRPEGQFALLGARSVGDHLPLDHPVTLANNRLLIDASVLVGTLELDQLIDIRTNFAGQLGGMMLTLHANDDALGVDRIDDAVALGQNDGSGVARGDAFHPGTDQRRFGHQQRNRLALHVGAHQCAVGVVMLEERDQRSGDRDQLFGADVDVVHFVLVHQHEVALPAGIDQVFHDLALRAELDVGLGNGVPVFFPRGKIEGEGIELDRPLVLRDQFFVEPQRFLLLQRIADAQTAFACVGDLHVVEDVAVAHAAIRRLDEAVFVDAGEAREELIRPMFGPSGVSIGQIRP